MPTEYQIKDQHAAPGLPQVMECQHYYPFGMQLEALGYTSGADLKNNYLYNGKELQEDYNLNWYDYGARMYDPVIGRWHSVDDLSESNSSWSPYSYAIDNPLRNVDPDGNDWWDVVNGSVRGVTDNVLGTDTRSSYTPTDPDDYNDALTKADITSLMFGVSETTVGGTATTGGIIAAPETGGASIAVSLVCAGVTAHGTVVTSNSIKHLASGNNYGRQNETKVYSTRKEAKDARPKPNPAKPNQKQVTHQTRNKSGEGNKMKTDGGKQTPHFHDKNHSNPTKTNVHYRKTKKVKET